jgi:hypothetical protein
LREVLLLIGDNTGQVIRGIFVEFDECILGAYRRILNTAYDLSLEWVYDEGAVRKPSNFDRVVASLGIDITWEQYRADVLLWRALQYDANLPLPDIARIIPTLFAFWNCFKSGSDTTTKLMDLVTLRVPVDGLQAHSVARILLVISVNIYRLMLISTGRKAVESFVTIGRWRNTASKRMGYIKALDTLADIFLCDGTVPPSGPPQGQTPSHSGEIRARTRNSLTSESYSDMTPGTTGGTPKYKKLKVYQAKSAELTNAQRLA